MGPSSKMMGQLIKCNGSFDLAELGNFQLAVLLLQQQLQSLVCFLLLLRTVNESYRARSLRRWTTAGTELLGEMRTTP